MKCIYLFSKTLLLINWDLQALTYTSWIEAMQDELLQFRLQKIWRLVDLPKDKNAIGTKWVYRNKKDERGIIDKGDILLVQVYVDDIIFGSTKKSLCTEFEVKTASTPIETNKALLKDEEVEDADVHLYRSMIGSLMYLTASRPDIIYLKGQPKLGLWYPMDSPFDLEALLDSDYARASLDRKSTIGGCQFLGKRLISWKCKKQIVVANLTTEAEYVAAANCYHNVADLLTKAFDVSSDEFGVKTGSCKVNAARQDLMLLGENNTAEEV
ncbi:hypothetical protein Tco_0098967 [Tanacetum coccineum]